MASCADAPDELRPPGVVRTLGVPLVAALLAAWVLAAGANEAVFHAVNDWWTLTGDDVWANASVLGEGAAVLALLGALIGRRPRHLLAALLALTLTTLLLHAVKDLVGAHRPGHVLGYEAIHVIGRRLSRRSFPSGHATTIFAAAALAFSLGRGATARGLALALAAVVALSRLAVGAHWPTDVLAGAALGWLCGCAALHVVERGLRHPSARLQLACGLPVLVGCTWVALPHGDNSDYELLRPLIAIAGLSFGLPALARLWVRGRSAQTRSGMGGPTSP